MKDCKDARPRVGAVFANTSRLAMAIITALLAWIGNRMSSLLQAVLGWSVTALFGRLPSRKQNALSFAIAGGWQSAFGGIRRQRWAAPEHPS